MSVPLLTTKLSIPPRHSRLVKRPRLIEQLNRDLWDQGSFRRKVTLVSAPAGYGKTTTVVEWLQGPSLAHLPQVSAWQDRACWLSLDESDNDPILLLSYLISAIQQLEPGFGETTRALLGAPQPPPGEALLTSLLNETAAIHQPFLLVMDDYHVIQIPAIHQLLGMFIERQPIRMHLVLVTREDPLLPIARLRARGQLLEVRQDDLRFSLVECADFVKNTMGISLSQDHIAALERRTEGWIAGLQLAALSMQGHPNPERFVQAFTGSSRFVLDFLVEEVFNQQPTKTQDFLIKTSILERLTGPLCDALTEVKNGQTTLENLEQANLFIIPLDQSRSWYRYHRLFAELLRHRLRSDDRFVEADLHNRASLWFKQNGWVNEAIHHAMAAGNWEGAAELVSGVNDEMLKRGETATLLRWYGRFPQEVILTHTKLCFDHSWALILTGQFDKAAPLLDHLEQLVEAAPAFTGELLTMQAFLARGLGDNVRMVERSQRALQLLPKEAVSLRGVVTLNLVLAYWHMGQMEATEQVLDEAIEATQADENQYGLITAIIFKGMVYAVRGQLHQAAEVFQQAIEQGGEIPINALAHLNMSALHYEWDNLPASEDHLQTAIELSQRGYNNELLVACTMFSTRLRLAQDDPGGARQALASIQELTRSGEIPSGTAGRAMATQVQFYLAQGDLQTALAMAEQLDEGVDCHPFYRFIGLSKALLWIAQKELQAARNHLHQLYEQARQRGWVYAQIAIRVWQALAAETKEQAAGYLGEALQMAQPGGFVRTFVEGGEALIPILQETAQRGIPPAYLEKILNAFHPAGKTQPDQAGLVEPLSERELEVLQLLVAGLSNREIAHRLVISLGTAKTHIHNIYGKLEASNRAQAIARAQEHHLA